MSAFQPLRPLREIPRFEYMGLAKALEYSEGYFLAGSGMAPPTFEEMGVKQSDLELNALCNTYGDPRALNLLSKRFNVDPSQIVLCAGSSEANALIHQILCEPGDEVLAETPGYEVFRRLPALNNAKYVPLERPEANGFLPDCDAIKAKLTNRTRLIVLTDMHNPTGVKMPKALLQEIFDIAKANGTYVLVDEVYLDHLAPGSEDETCFPYADNVIVTSSLTKVYGFGPLRAGWCFAPKELADRMIDLIDLNAVELPGIAQNLFVRALEHQQSLRARTRAIAKAGWPIVAEWAASRDDVELLKPAGGITASVKVKGLESSTELAIYLREEQGVLVVPGDVFEMPGWLRVRTIGEESWMRQAYAALSKGLDAYKARA